MYDYNNGRFLSVDPFIQDPSSTQSLNPYTYIFNNPLSGTNPTGYLGYTGSVCVDGLGCIGGGANDTERNRQDDFRKFLNSQGSSYVGLNGNTNSQTSSKFDGTFFEEITGIEGMTEQRFLHEFGTNSLSIEERINNRFISNRGANGIVAGIPEQRGFNFLFDEFVTKGFGNLIGSFRENKTNPLNGNILSEGQAFDERVIGSLTSFIGGIGSNALKSTSRIAQGSFNPAEQSIADYLTALGREVWPNPDEGINGLGRQADAFVDFLRVEFKSLGINTNSSITSNSIKNAVNKSVKDGGQARNIIFDARNTNLTENEALRGVYRSLGANRGKLDNISVIGDDYFIGGGN